MCQRVRCPRCGKPTFAGCGMHVEQVLGDVPRDQRCKCHEHANTRSGEDQASILSRLFGRSS